MYLSHAELLPHLRFAPVGAGHVPPAHSTFKRSKLLLQASLRRSSGLFPLVISLIPGCSALRAPATFKSIRNPLIFLRKMATYSCFWRAKRSKLLLQASLRRSSGLFPLVISLIPGCSALRAPATFKSIRNPLIFLRKMAAYSCFWRAKRSKLLLQASLRRSSGLFSLGIMQTVA